MSEIESSEYLPGADEAIPEPATDTALIVAPQTANPLAARDAGIASYLASAYAKAGTLRLTLEETKALKADFADDDFVTGAAGKESLIYIDPRRLRDRLDEALGMGGWSLVPVRTWNEDYKTSSGAAIRVYRECVLIVRGVFITQATGDMSYYPANQSQNYGDAYQGAESHSLRRCLKNFGVGLQAYSKPFQSGWFERKQAALRGKNGPGRAATPPPPSTATPPVTTPPAGSGGVKQPKIATATTRAYVLDALGAQEEGVPRNTLHAYLVALGWLENEKVVEQWPVRFIPICKEEIEGFKVGLASFSQNGQAVMPYEPHGLDPSTLAPPVKSSPPPEPDLPPPTKGWRDYTLTFGVKTKGKTLGSFSEQEVRNYCENFTVRESVENADGSRTVYPAEIVAAQRELRAALDEAAKEMAAKKG